MFQGGPLCPLLGIPSCAPSSWKGEERQPPPPSTILFRPPASPAATAVLHPATEPRPQPTPCSRPARRSSLPPPLAGSRRPETSHHQRSRCFRRLTACLAAAVRPPKAILCTPVRPDVPPAAPGLAATAAASPFTTAAAHRPAEVRHAAEEGNGQSQSCNGQGICDWKHQNRQQAGSQRQEENLRVASSSDALGGTPCRWPPCGSDAY